MNEQIEIRILGMSGVRQLLKWAKEEGWNPGLDDAAAFYIADKDGFLGCFVDDVLVSGISCVCYGDDFGFIGLYITRPDMRGKGFGLRVWNEAMDRLKGRIIGLDGVPEQQDNYSSMEFAKAYETVRWSKYCQFNNNLQAYEVLEIGIDQLEEVTKYDCEVFSASRSAFLELWLSSPRTTFALMEAGRLAGYAVLRECDQGFKLGPLFSDSDVGAKKLLSAAINACAGAVLHIDVPTHQTSIVSFLSELGFEAGFGTARMYKGGMPKTDMTKVFAITSLELG